MAGLHSAGDPLQQKLHGRHHNAGKEEEAGNQDPGDGAGVEEEQQSAFQGPPKVRALKPLRQERAQQIEQQPECKPDHDEGGKRSEER